MVQYDGLTPNEFALRRAEFHKSIQFNLNEALSKVAFQPSYQPKSEHEWPEFYLFVTGTRQLLPSEIEETGEKNRMTDGLLLSENYLRT